MANEMREIKLWRANPDADWQTGGQPLPIYRGSRYESVTAYIPSEGSVVVGLSREEAKSLAVSTPPTFAARIAGRKVYESAYDKLRTALASTPERREAQTDE